jgi:hypothetical protein
MDALRRELSEILISEVSNEEWLLHRLEMVYDNWAEKT